MGGSSSKYAYAASFDELNSTRPRDKSSVECNIEFTCLVWLKSKIDGSFDATISTDLPFVKLSADILSPLVAALSIPSAAALGTVCMFALLNGMRRAYLPRTDDVQRLLSSFQELLTGRDLIEFRSDIEYSFDQLINMAPRIDDIEMKKHELRELRTILGRTLKKMEQSMESKPWDRIKVMMFELWRLASSLYLVALRGLVELGVFSDAEFPMQQYEAKMQGLHTEYITYRRLNIRMETSDERLDRPEFASYDDKPQMRRRFKLDDDHSMRVFTRSGTRRQYPGMGGCRKHLWRIDRREERFAEQFLQEYLDFVFQSSVCDLCILRVVEPAR